MKLVDYFRLLLLGMWLGAAVFFSAVLAPNAFSVLRGYQSLNAGEIAGAIVNRNLTAVNLSGFVVGLIVFVSGFVGYRKVRYQKIAVPAFMIEIVSVILMIISTAVGHWVIATKLRALRLTLTGPIDQLTVSDPKRVYFDQLHAYSVKALGVAMIAAFVSFVVITLRARRDV